MNTNRIAVAALVVAALGIGALGCGGATGKLKSAASHDFNCPKSQVHLLGSGKTRDVEACGNRATYHYEEGEWLMLRRSGPVGAPQIAPGQPVQPHVNSTPAPINAPAQSGHSAPALTATATPSMPPSSPPPPVAPGQKAL